MLYVVYIDIDGSEHAMLCYSFDQYFECTFSPACEVLTVLEFKTRGNTYRERKEYVRNLAIEYSLSIYPGLSWGDLAAVQTFFEKVAKRYGLIREFKENAII